MKSLNLITGPNGCGKSNLYRGLRLLAATATGSALESLAFEGGMDSVLWAGPENFSKAVKRGDFAVQGGPRRDRVRLQFGFLTDDFSYSIDFGVGVPSLVSMFSKDPEIKREAIWQGEKYHSSRTVVDRNRNVVRVRDRRGQWSVVEEHLPTFESMLSRGTDPRQSPETMMVREYVRSWRFYDHLRSDPDSPARRAQIGTLTPVLSGDGRELAAAWRTIVEIGDSQALERALEDAFPKASVEIVESSGRFELLFSQYGLLRPLRQAELSDGTLKYLLWIAALLTPRPPKLMVLNEPETSLHPDLLPALGRLMIECAKNTQLWVISHSNILIEALREYSACNCLELDKELGETHLVDQTMFNTPVWQWPAR